MTMTPAPRVVVLMGVSGSGKTTAGRLLAERYPSAVASFHDADWYHSDEAWRKMHARIPLDDHDRRPMYDRLRREVIEPSTTGEKTVVIACPALTRLHRRWMSGSIKAPVAFVFLKGNYDLIYTRMVAREGAFRDSSSQFSAMTNEHRQIVPMQATMLATQMSTLEAPSEDEAVHVSIDQTPQQVVDEIHRRILVPLSVRDAGDKAAPAFLDWTSFPRRSSSAHRAPGVHQPPASHHSNP